MQSAFSFASPRSRNTDPVSSHEAAERQRKGKANTDAMRVLQTIRKAPGSTSAEIAAICGLDRHAVARRCPDLEERQLVKRGEIRKCKAHGTNAVTWWPA